MNSLELSAFAKINLGINVFERLENNYHRVDMVMHAVALCDNICIEIESGDENRIDLKLEEQGCAGIPGGSENLAYRAAEAILRKTAQSVHVSMSLSKKIPVAAGLAGGSSDAAAVLLGLNYLLDMKLTLDRVAEIGARIGADIAFCVYANALGNKTIFEGLTEEDKSKASFCMRARGIGEVLNPLRALDARVTLFKPDFEVSTAEVYEGLSGLDKEGVERPDIEGLISAVEAGDIEGVASSAGNVLEAYTLTKYPQITKLKRAICEARGTYLTMMSGSGPTLFALYKEEDNKDFDLEYCKSKKVKLFDTYLMKGGIDDVRL